VRKRTIAVLRRHERDAAHLPAWFDAAELAVTDVTRWDDVRILRLDHAGVAQTYVNGVNLAAHDLVYWAGPPGDEGPAPIGRDGWYRIAERTAALMAAVSALRGPRVINPGEALLLGRQLSDPHATLRGLGQAGWRTPTEATRFDLAHEGPLGPPQSLRRPLPGEDRELAVFTLTAPPFLAARPEAPASTSLLARAGATREMMRRLGWDWATVAIAFVDGELCAYGVRPELPRSLSASVAADLIRALLPPRARREAAA